MTIKKNRNKQASLTEEIANVIRERILKGEYAIGEKIKESSIAKELEVSRTPIREAFRQLEDEGVIDYVKNKGCYARSFTAQDISDIYAVRSALEEMAVVWAIERISADDISNLKEQWELMEFYTGKGDIQKVLKLNSAFHAIIYKAADSRFLMQVLTSYKGYLDKLRRNNFYTQEYLERILDEHKLILDAVVKKDKEAAKTAVANHLKNSAERTGAVWKINE